MQLRSQIAVTEPAQKQADGWSFVFHVENHMVYGEDLAELAQDAEGVPMITGLDEQDLSERALRTQGPDQNIWFDMVNI